MTTPRRSVSDSVVSGILAEVSTGMTLDSACKNAGITRQSFYYWLRDEPQLVEQFAQAKQQQTQNRFAKG